MILSEAVAEGKRIRVTVFDAWEDRVYEGVPVMRGHSMYVDAGEERHQAELSEIIGVELSC